jgi:hypothetical protein
MRADLVRVRIGLRCADGSLDGLAHGVGCSICPRPDLDLLLILIRVEDAGLDGVDRSQVELRLIRQEGGVVELGVSRRRREMDRTNRPIRVTCGGGTTRHPEAMVTTASGLLEGLLEGDLAAAGVERPCTSSCLNVSHDVIVQNLKHRAQLLGFRGSRRGVLVDR